MDGGSWWTRAGDGVVVTVRVTPAARRSEVIDAAGERLRVRLAAPAVDGKANAELRRFLGELFGVRSSAVTVIRGERSREKSVHIAGVTDPPDL